MYMTSKSSKCNLFDVSLWPRRRLPLMGALLFYIVMIYPFSLEENAVMCNYESLL